MEGEYVAFRGHFLFFFSLNHLKALKLYSFENNLNTIRHMCQNDLSITLTLLRLSCDNTGFTETYNTTVSKAIISYRVKAKTGSLRGCPYCYIGSRRLMSPAKVFSGTFFLILRFFMAALFRLNFFTLQLKKKNSLSLLWNLLSHLGCRSVKNFFSILTTAQSVHLQLSFSRYCSKNKGFFFWRND